MIRTTRIKWGGVLMMGGRGQRMGGVDKSTLTLNGQSFWDIAISRLEKSFHCVGVSTGPMQIPDMPYDQFTDLDVCGEFIGPVGGLLAALQWAEYLGLAGILSLPVDTPILPDTICEDLCVSDGPCYAQYGDQPHWLHATWPLSAASTIRHLILEKQVYSLRGLHRTIGSTPVIFQSTKNGDFNNINTVQDLQSLNKAV